MEILNDFSTSVRKALEEIDKKYESYPGLVICGTHTPHDVEAMIQKITKARECGLPFLGSCFGHQLAAIEYARNCLGIENATSEEFGKGTFVVKKRKSIKVGLHDGETFWNNYEVIDEIYQKWEKPKNFFTSQSHPEYQSSIDRPHPLLISFISFSRNYEKLL